MGDAEFEIDIVAGEEGDGFVVIVIEIEGAGEFCFKTGVVGEFLEGGLVGEDGVFVLLGVAVEESLVLTTHEFEGFDELPE